MAGYNNIIGRSQDVSPFVPDQMISQIIQDAPASSVILSNARRVPMSSKTAKQPVLASLPEAYWVNGDTGLKETTKASWENVFMTAEELAVIVPIPDALVDDSNIPLWTEVQPLLREAIGKALDDAAIFGVNKPDSWPSALVPGAITAGNVVKAGTNADFGADVAALGAKMAANGAAISGFASVPGLNWRLVGLRDTNGQPIYTPSMAEGAPSSLYGYPLNEVRNGTWNSEAADLLAVDWSKVVVGIRQDITFDIFREGVITDNTGKVLLNLMQQDTKALRVVFRVGFQVAQPLSRQTGSKPYPAGVITPATV